MTTTQLIQILATYPVGTKVFVAYDSDLDELIDKTPAMKVYDSWDDDKIRQAVIIINKI